LLRDEAHVLDILKAATGAAVKRLWPEFKAAHPEVPSKQIAGTRYKLTHFYEGVDLDQVWGMVTADVPELTRQGLRP
jgi:uncharacterized protein with HEPN domain